MVPLEALEQLIVEWRDYRRQYDLDTVRCRDKGLDREAEIFYWRALETQRSINWLNTVIDEHTDA